MHIALLVDASHSMMFEEKLLLARRIAAAFGVIGAARLGKSERVCARRRRRRGISRHAADARVVGKLFALHRRHRGRRRAADRRRHRGIPAPAPRARRGRGAQRFSHARRSPARLQSAAQCRPGTVGPANPRPQPNSRPTMTDDLRLVDSETGATSTSATCATSSRSTTNTAPPTKSSSPRSASSAPAGSSA